MFQTETLFFFIKSHQYSGSIESLLGIIKVAPKLKLEKISYTDKSKLSFEIPIKTSFSDILNLLFISIIVFMAALWLTSTPLGNPVDPEVKIT